MSFCNKCGNEYKLGEVKCPKCGNNLPQISAQLYPESDSAELTNPKSKRIAAGMIDITVVIAIALFILLSKKMLLTMFLRRGIAILIPHFYLLLKDSIEGKSIGKVIMGIAVYNEHEKKAGGVVDSIIRNWYLAIPFVGPTFFATFIGGQLLAGKRTRLGDKGANTVVITDSDFQRLK